MEQLIVVGVCVAGLLVAAVAVVWQNRGDARRQRQIEMERDLLKSIAKATEASHAKANEAVDRTAASDRDATRVVPGTVLPPVFRRD